MLTQKELLSYSTVKIETFDVDGNKSTGTGFIVNLAVLADKEQIVPIIITNKHVVEGGVKFRINFCLAGADHQPIDDQHFPIEFTTQILPWVMHPEHDVDLCAIPIAPLDGAAVKNGKRLYYVPLGLECIPNAETISHFDAIEDIHMIGYPIGLSDEINNKPIVRKGITATHFMKDYNGKKEFVIDCACYPGSSGSPVFVINSGNFTSKEGKFMYDTSRLFLLGVLWGGPQFDAGGELHVVDIPTAQTAFVSSSIPMNLGFVIKSQKILDFLPLFGIQ